LDIYDIIIIAVLERLHFLSKTLEINPAFSRVFYSISLLKIILTKKLDL